MGCLKLVILGIVVAIIVFACDSCDRPRQPSGQRAPAATPHVDNRANLTGVWRGTSRTNQGFGGKEILAFREGNNHRAQIHIFPVPGSPAGFPTGSWLADVRFNSNTGMIELVQTRVLAAPHGGGYVPRRGRLTGNTFTGTIDGHHNSSFNLDRVARSNFTLAANVPHTHIASTQSRMLTAATCLSDGVLVYDCVFCRQETRRTTTPRSSYHTPSGAWVILRPSTCSQSGLRVQYCRYCPNEIVRREDIPLAEHNIAGVTQWVTVLDPSCLTAGHRVKFCLDCNQEAASETIPALTGSPHVFTVNMLRNNIFVPPIISENICEICNYIETNRDWSLVWVPPVILLGLTGAAIVTLRTRTAIRKKRTFVCPYCFETCLVQNIQFRCANFSCKEVPDMELEKYEGIVVGPNTPRVMRKITFPAPKAKDYAIQKFADCPKCKRETSKIVCPSCHNSLPECSLLGEDMIISVVGSRDVGKSHFVGVIIHELIERVSGKFEGSVTGFDDTLSRYEENFGHKLYRDLMKLDLTKSSTSNKSNGAYKPFIFTFSIREKGLLSKVGKSKIKNFTLVFYDTAGEDLNEFDTMNTVNRYICKSAGIIFLLDPMQIWTVRNQLPDEVVSRASSVAVQQATRPDDIMTRVSKLIRNERKKDGPIDIPVAAVFSKFDAIESLVPPGCKILDPSPHCEAGAFVLSDWHNVNKEIQSLLKNWGATAFTQQLELNYTKHSYFTVSSLGHSNSPRVDGNINRPQPHRIEDPLLWILKENKVIKSKK